MKWFAVVLALAGAFYLGSKSAHSPKPAENLEGIRAEFEHLSQEELRDYQELKDNRQKFEAANKILAKVMKIFIADLGLKSIEQKNCRINSEFTKPLPLSEPPPAPTPVAIEPMPTPTPAARNRVGTAIGRKVTTPTRTTRNSSPDAPSSSRRLIFGEEKAKGAVNALYQAVLWRQPDRGGGTEATSKFSEEGWGTYIRNARQMVQSTEFLKDVEPNHTPQQIVNHMYSVYMGRCAFANEMNDHLRSLSNAGPGQVISSIISKARQNNADQIFTGGFSPSSCTE